MQITRKKEIKRYIHSVYLDTKKMIIDIAYITTNSLNTELVSLATSNVTQTNKLITSIENKIFLKMCVDQFVDSGSSPTTHTFPSDLKQATLHLLENYVASFDEKGVKKRILRSVKFDDFWETFEKEENKEFIPLSFYGIPINKNYLAIIQKYECVEDTIVSWFFWVKNF